uniref:Uncharacterized protein n=1 Tax=Myotis myotis TaxID=51298 RepID=A0A7J7SCB2_MYOMY|nr:hypothetical protein mMyoMyo1_009553 [Myotis myotis]
MFLGGLPALGAAFVPSGSASCCPQPSFPGVGARAGRHPPAPQKAVRCSEGVGGADSRAGSAPGPRLSPGEGAGLTSRPVCETLEAEEQGEGTSHPAGGGRSAPAAVWWGLAGAAPGEEGGEEGGPPSGSGLWPVDLICTWRALLSGML